MTRSEAYFSGRVQRIIPQYEIQTKFSTVSYTSQVELSTINFVAPSLSAMLIDELTRYLFYTVENFLEPLRSLCRSRHLLSHMEADNG